MKKYNLVALGAAALLMFSAQDVSAITPADIGYPGSNVTSVKNANEVYELTLTGDANQDLIVSPGEEVILDLNGYTLSNYTAAVETIKVLPGGSLVIKDSSPSKTGKVTHKADSTYGVITNQGVMVIDGGNFVTDLNFYIVRNEANLVINGGSFTKLSDVTALIGNIGTEEAPASLTINGGEFLSSNNVILNYEYNDVIIKNGILTSKLFYALDNWGTAEVKGGNLTSESNSVIRYGSDDSTDTEVNLVLSKDAVYTSAADKDVLFIDDAKEVGLIEKLKFDSGVLTDEEIIALLGDEYETIVSEDGVITIGKKQEELPKEDETPKDDDEQYAPVTPPAQEEQNKEEIVPETSDEVVVSFVLATVSTIGLAGGALYIKKEKVN